MAGCDLDAVIAFYELVHGHRGSLSRRDDLFPLLMKEELTELLQAVESYRAMEISETRSATIKESILEEAADVVITVCGQLLAVGIHASSLPEAVRRKAAANLSKLDGGVRRRLDGKVLKGAHYRPPILSDLVE